MTIPFQANFIGKKMITLTPKTQTVPPRRRGSI